MGGIRTTLVLAVLGCLLALAGPTASEAGPQGGAERPSVCRRYRGPRERYPLSPGRRAPRREIDVKIDGEVVASCPTWWCRYVWQSSTVPNGDHVVKAIAYSPSTIVIGQVARTEKVLNAAGDTTPPTVTLRVPASATGVVSLQASATDNNRVVTTEIFVDDVRVATSTTAQVSFPWNTTSTANGPHQDPRRGPGCGGQRRLLTRPWFRSAMRQNPQGFPNEHDGKRRWWPTGDRPAIGCRRPD